TWAYNAGAVVWLLAAPDTGYRFANWTGDVGQVVDRNSADTVIRMFDDYAITANFAPVMADLSISAIAPDPIAAKQGHEITVSVTIENTGDESAQGFWVDVYKHQLTAPEAGALGDYSSWVNDLGPGESETIPFLISYDSLGAHQLWAQADTDQFVVESSEANNVYGPVAASIAANEPPTAFVDSITPDPADHGVDTVRFEGHATDVDGSMVAYNWRSSIDGHLSTSRSFDKSASELSAGAHTIYFKLQDDDGAWSTEVTAELNIIPQDPPIVTTNETSDTTANSATLNASLDSLGDYSAVHVSFEWGAGPGVCINETSPQEMTSTGPFSAGIDGLTSNTAYYFRAKAT
ncbi:unnamed protein product, partial [marine sediment metagenome]